VVGIGHVVQRGPRDRLAEAVGTLNTLPPVVPAPDRAHAQADSIGGFGGVPRVVAATRCRPKLPCLIGPLTTVKGLAQRPVDERSVVDDR